MLSLLGCLRSPRHGRGEALALLQDAASRPGSNGSPPSIAAASPLGRPRACELDILTMTAGSRTKARPPLRRAAVEVSHAEALAAVEVARRGAQE
jgi:hypothetical protein